MSFLSGCRIYAYLSLEKDIDAAQAIPGGTICLCREWSETMKPAARPSVTGLFQAPLIESLCFGMCQVVKHLRRGLHGLAEEELDMVRGSECL
jgi:hypothetical protein